ncbi:MAG: AraC family transcriptional regulator [Spirochaetes bacterium]|nr:AraC family transcriptional regulator [Spirochaetota bacterium]
MENLRQKYLLCADNKNTFCFSDTDVNPVGNTSPLPWSIQSHFPYGKGNFHAAVPSDRYKNIIAFYTQIHVIDNSRYWRTIFPEGRNAAIVFRCDYHKPGAFIVGNPTFPREAEYVISGGDYFFVFLCPCMGYAFSPLPATELTNKSFPLNEIMPGESKTITEKILRADTFRERVSLFEGFMEGHMPLLKKIPEQVIHNIFTIRGITGYLPNESPVSYSIYTDRHIRRLYRKYIGMSPKLYADLLRHQKTLRILNANPYYDLNELASEVDYYDQSHFIKKFKKFTGITPTQFVRDIIQVQK